MAVLRWALLALISAARVVTATPSQADGLGQIAFQSALQESALFGGHAPGAHDQTSALSYPNLRIFSADADAIYTISTPSLPAHTLRLTQPPAEICETHQGTRSWSGYLDVDLDALWEHEQQQEGRSDGELYGERLLSVKDRHGSEKPRGVVEHFFFWVFESRSDSKDDPTVLWLNGGPGCSSGCGLLMELGPCNARPYNGTKGPHTKMNPYSWTNNASVIFLDQPVGTGFSYASWKDNERNKQGKAPSRIYTAREAARDTSAFLQLWAMHAKELLGQPISAFHLAGESYAGRWVPLIATQLLEDNKKAAVHPEHGIKPLPVDSVLIGNGWTSPSDQFVAYVDYACSNKTGFGVFLPEDQCDVMRGRVPVCLALTEKCNTPMNGTRHDELACIEAQRFCETALSGPWSSTGRSTYDYQHHGDYEEDEWFSRFLNDDKTKEALGIDRLGAGDTHNGTYTSCSEMVYKHFEKTGDGAKDSTWAIQDLLKNRIRVLLYVGERDFICNYLGIDKWSRDLQWDGREGFREAELIPWYHPGSDETSGLLEAGKHRTFANLTFLTVHEASHFVPYSQPAASLKMLNAWIHNGGPPK